MLDYCYWLRRSGVGYVGDPRTAGDFLPCVRPTALGAVPRFYEKVIERIEARRRGLGPLPRRLFDWALRTGHEWNSWREQTGAVPPGLRLRHRLAGLLVYRRIHRARPEGSPGVRAFGNLARHHAQPARAKPQRNGRPADPRHPGSHRRRR